MNLLQKSHDLIVAMVALSNKYMDKFLHFTFSCIEVLILSWLFGLIWGVVLTLCIGLGKELYDSYQVGNKWDWYDFLSDVLGVILGVLLFRI